MFKEPFFQKDILGHILQYMSYYLGYENWFVIFCSVLLFLYCCYKVLMYHNNVSYEGNFPSEKYTFSLKNKKEQYAFVFLIFCVVFNVLAIFSQEMSFFGNYDLRGSVIPIFERGVLPAWGVYFRFYPFSFWDTNIVYSITHHLGIINLYLSMQSLIIVLLLNCFLKFLPVCRRFLCIGLIVISPVIFSIGSIVFSERMLLMYILGSLICMKKYSEQPNKKYFLWFTVLLINFALYSKELCVLFYFGILLYYCFIRLFRGEIVPNSFLRPVKTARAYPFETLLFLSLVAFFAIYQANMGSMDNAEYISSRQLDLYTRIGIYYTEILATIIVLVLMIKTLFYKQKYVFMEGMALGSVIVAVCVFFVFKIGHLVPSMLYKSYYLIIPYVIGLIYIFWHLKNKYICIALCLFLGINSIIKNYVIYQNEDGIYYREVVEYIMKGKEYSQVDIFLSKHSEYGNWFCRSWSLPSGYYWPNADIRVYSSGADLKTMDFIEQDKVFYKESPNSGDYFVIRKNEFYQQDIREIVAKDAYKIFENKMFEVYAVQ